MKTIQKKLRKNELLPHPELLGKWSELWSLVAKIHVPFFIFLLFYQDYIPLLASLDAVIVASLVMFAFVVKPLMMRGMIKAYYRKSYTGLKMTIWSFICIGAVIRTTMLALYYGFTFSWISGDANNVRYVRYSQDFQENFSNGLGLILGVLICGYMFFDLYYKDRFISVRDFSSKVVRSMKQLGYGYEEASYQVLHDRDRHLEQDALQHVKYHNSGSGDIFNMFRGNTTENSQSSSSSTGTEANTAFSPMRRQARK